MRKLRRFALPAVLAIATWILFVTDHAPGTDAALHGFPLDDAWIHLVYARGLVEEGGLHYNAGVPEAGMTSPLWVFLLAGVHAMLGHGPVEHIVLGAKILSLVLGVAGVVTLGLLARALGESRGVAILAAGLAAVDPSLSFARASGMEVPLFVFLVLVSLLFALRGRPIATGLTAGLAIVARPEGIILFPLLIGLLGRGTRHGGRAARRGRRGGRLLLAAILAVLPGAAYSLFCWSATGSPLPNTFYAKFVAANPLSPSLLALGWRNYVHGNLPYFTLEAGTVLALLGAIRLVRRGGLAAAATFAAGLLLFVAALASRGFVPGHYFYWERWLMPSFPFLLLALAAGVGEVYDGCATFRSRHPLAPGGRRELRGLRWARTAWRGAAVAAGILLLWAFPSAFQEKSELFAWNTQNIEEMNVTLGRWVDANLARDAVIAVNDAGALRYFGKRETVDLMGLNDHRLLRQDSRLGTNPLETLGVDYVIVFPQVFRDLVRRFPLRPVHEVRSPHYTICDGPQDLMVVFRWEQRGRDSH